MNHSPGAAPPRSHRVVIFSTIVAALGGLLFGFDTAVISGTTGALEREFELSSNGLGFTVAIALIGTVIGALSVGKPADWLGRKRSLMVIAVMYFISAVGSALATVWGEFLVYRLIGGLAVGAASVVAPMYIAEISPAAMRGRLVAINQLNVVGGILLAFLSNYVIGLSIDDATAWRWMLGIEAVPAALFLALLFLIPYSPRWLVKKGRTLEAHDVLVKMGEPNVEQELADIERSLVDDDNGASDRLFQRKYMFPIFCAWAIAMFNQLSGINALMYYAPRIFESAGFSTEASLLQAVLVGGTNFMFTVIALFMIDKLGRRPLLFIGSIGTAASLFLVSFQFMAEEISGSLVLYGLLGFIAAFAISQGAVIWVFISEIFPNRVRAKGQAFGSFTHWFMAAAVSWLFPVFADGNGGLVFIFFGLMMVLQFLFVWKIMPETKGTSLEDLEYTLHVRDNAPDNAKTAASA
ncbi:sugar porter family MFS transporter [Marinimicrobium sp. LS-A18]|uniref:sugar porter family MFS transporter n=1 Tax=Marinimicrobium sp. LS-A18 TaxID=1381596 RepID=UPI000466846A|nr:sugar porter family MFS transporter [Marinimicrobium sp. LS-A18]